MLPHTPFPDKAHEVAYRLTVRLLVPRARTGTAELLGLAPSVVGNEQCAVVLDESLLELVLRVLVDVLLVVGDDGFGNGLADGVDLRGVSTAGDANADVDIGCIQSDPNSQFVLFPGLRRGVRTELVNAEDQDGLVDLESQDLGLDQGKRLSVDLDQTLTGLEITVSMPFECALDRGGGGVPCSGRQLGEHVSLCFRVWTWWQPYQSRSSSCRSIARSGKPCWTTVGMRACGRWAWICGCLVVSRRRSCSVPTSKL
jgi:hypothetical protein